MPDLCKRFLSTLSLRRATIHYDNYNLHCVISIHALLAESDLILHMAHLTEHLFLSTLSLRRATDKLYYFALPETHFYPRSPCGERPQWRTLASGMYGFLSTLSLRRATSRLQHRWPQGRYFYPRSPCGERPRAHRTSPTGCGFLSTLSLRRATNKTGQFKSDKEFLSTLSLRRATCLPSPFNIPSGNFYPRSPCGERPVTTLGAGSDRDFYPRSPCGERQFQTLLQALHKQFLSTLSLRRAT